MRPRAFAAAVAQRRSVSAGEPRRRSERMFEHYRKTGVHGLVVLSAAPAGREEREQFEHRLVENARRLGMRILGPECLGIVNTDPETALQATVVGVQPRRGRIGWSSQSGAIGLDLLVRATDAGLGVSTFVSLGDKADVSGNDLLQYWDADPDTDVILLYMESFGNPRKFARIARRVARRKPVVAVKSARSAAGSRGAAVRTPVTRWWIGTYPGLSTTAGDPGIHGGRRVDL